MHLPYIKIIYAFVAMQPIVFDVYTYYTGLNTFQITREEFREQKYIHCTDMYFSFPLFSLNYTVFKTHCKIISITNVGILFTYVDN